MKKHFGVQKQKRKYKTICNEELLVLLLLFFDDGNRRLRKSRREVKTETRKELN